jgi:hypothetical protein
MYDRPFGVEIECNSNGRGAENTRLLLQRNGFPNWARVGYDGSDIEIKSPILRGAQGLRELEYVMNLLKKNHYYTTEDDGMHCHFDVSDLNETAMIRIIKSWNYNQDVVKRFLGDRFYNDFCAPFSDSAIETMERSPNGLWYFDGDKCHAIEPRSRFRTLEFRQHYGTIEFEEARAWILLVQAFIKNVANRKRAMTSLSMEELFKRTRVYKIAQENLVARA